MTSTPSDPGRPAPSHLTDDIEEIPLWPGAPPGSERENPAPEDEHEIWAGEPGRETVAHVTRPTLAVFPAEPGRANGAALVIAPGGGYTLLAIHHEGWQVARRFALTGITCFVLKYRHFEPGVALRDAQCALRLVRRRSAQWNIDPRRIGFAGFSIGGHLALHAATTSVAPPVMDDPETRPPRPDFLLLVYPSGIRRLPPAAVIDASFPPMFLATAVGDRVDERALPLLEKLTGLGLRYEAHLFAEGRHGDGLYPDLGSTGRWPELFCAWLAEQIEPAGGMKPARLQSP